MSFYKEIVIDASNKAHPFNGTFHSKLVGDNASVMVHMGTGTDNTKGISLGLSYMYDAIRAYVYESSKEDYDKVLSYVDENKVSDIIGFLLSKLSPSDLVEITKSIYKTGVQVGEQGIQQKMRAILGV